MSGGFIKKFFEFLSSDKSLKISSLKFMDKPPEAPSISGCLKRKSKILGIWSSRYCWLFGKTLYFSKDNDVKHGKEIPITPETEILLEDDRRVPRFTIICPDGKKYTFSSQLQEIFAWVFALRACKKSDSRLSIDDFKIHQVLGRGFYGKVMLVEKLDTKVLYALKTIRKKKLNDASQISTVIAERNLLSTLPDFPFIVNLCFCFQTDHKFYIGLEYAPGGELLNFLSTLPVISIDDIRLYLAEITLALHFLHENGIIYRDLKPENILLDKDGHIKLTDFGLSKKVEDGVTNTFCGTPEYLAPEIILRQDYDFRVDWWALGCLLFEINFGDTPFYDENQDVMFENILTKDPVFPKKGHEGAKDLIKALLVKSPDERLSFEQIKAHPFFNGLDWEKVLNKQIKPVSFQGVNETPPLDSEAHSINPTSWNIDGFSIGINESSSLI